MSRTVTGVGVFNKGKYSSKCDGKRTKEYCTWARMIYRCYSEDFIARWPTYEGCTVSENFKNFQYFAEWCNNQVGFGESNYELDKDIILKGNKVYDENLCAFVPKQLNYLLTKSNSSRGAYPIGVSLHKPNGSFRVMLAVSGVNKHLGYFSTPEEAFLVYKQAKEFNIKLIAEQYKDAIDVRVHDALKNWEVSIND